MRKHIMKMYRWKKDESVVLIPINRHKGVNNCICILDAIPDNVFKLQHFPDDELLNYPMDKLSPSMLNQYYNHFRRHLRVPIYEIETFPELIQRMDNYLNRDLKLNHEYEYLFEVLHTETEEKLHLVCDITDRELVLIRHCIPFSLKQMSHDDIDFLLSDYKLYRHYKGPVYCKEKDVILDNPESDDVWMTIYHRVDNPYKKYARPKDMFDGLTDDGTKRFLQVGMWL